VNAIHPPTFLDEAARRDWWAVWLNHEGCEPDPPDTIPHWCLIRSLLLQNVVVRRWRWLSLHHARAEGLT
jgi:hypothetical protein